jgi:hypothetical protein
MHSLAICYSFDENYIENYLNDPIRKSYQWLYKSKVNGIDTSDMIRHITTADFTQRDLKDNEVFMNIELYNSIFNTNYSSSTVNNFIPHEAYLEASDEYEDISFSKMVKIVGIGSTKASRFEVSSEMFKEIKETMIARYGIYFDGDDLSTIVDYCMNNEYSAISIEMSAIQTMIKAVSIFENFFTLIVVILLVGCAFIVVGFGIKNIKSRMYEIGVLKPYAEPLLKEIKPDSQYYSQAKKLLNFLQYFEPIESNAIPNNSIIREFIGGSCFEL